LSDWLEAEQRVERAHELYERGRWDEAESELRRAISVNPYQAEWHFNLGLTLEAAGRYEQAAAAFEAAATLEPDESGPAISAASNLVRVRRSEAALDWLARAESAGSTAPELFVYRIEALSDLGRHEEAELAFYMGQQQHSGHADLYAAMGEAMLDRGLIEKGMWCLREATRLDPETPAISARLARAYEQAGRLERARQLYTRELRSNPGDVDTLLDLAALLRRMNRPAEAAEKLRRVLELEPKCAEAHSAMAELAEDAGDVDAAITELDVALRLDPETEDGRLRLAELLLRRKREHDRAWINGLLSAEFAAVEKARASGDHSADLQALVDALLDGGRPAEATRAARWMLEEDPDSLTGRHLLSVALLEAGEDEAGMAEAREVVRREAGFVPAMHNLALAHMRRREWLRARYWVAQAVQADREDASVRRLRLRIWLQSVASMLAFVGRRAARAWVFGSTFIARRRLG
jgi:tetratricopeptide (TPR) repeat protein